MPFEKGKAKTGGRTKGTPNTVNLNLRQQVQCLLENHVEQIKNDLEALEPKDRVNAWVRLLDFALPKLQRVETTYDLSTLTADQVELLFDRATAHTNASE
jgi:hypothetical protein